EGPVKRFLAVLSTAMVLAALVPGVATASRVSKEHVDRISIGCSSTDETVAGDTFVERDATTGDIGFAEVWLEGSDPTEDPPSLQGVTESIDIDMAAEITFSADIAVTDADGNPAGQVAIVGSVTPAGDPFVDTGFDEGNANSHTMIFIQSL